MGRNTFFELNHELCATSQSLSYFDYKGLKCKGNKGYKKYPIYLFISSDSLNFLFHLGAESANNEGEHQHNYLFEISFGNIEDGLADVYRGDITFNEETMLNRTIKYAYLKRRRGVRKGITFSDLEQADLLYPEEFIGCKGLTDNCKRMSDLMAIDELEVADDLKDKARKIKWKKYNYPLCRKVFLDFMFDFEINNTFKDLPFYNQIRKELHANPTYNAIYTRLKFYYLRWQVKANVDSDIVLRKLEELIDAEVDWINIIKNPASECLFHYSPWFNDVEDEAMQVCTPKENRMPYLIKKIKSKEDVAIGNNAEKQNAMQERFKNLINKDKESVALLYNRLLQKYGFNHVLHINAYSPLKKLSYFEITLFALALVFHYFFPICTDCVLFSAGVLVISGAILYIGVRSRTNPLNLNLLYPRFFIAICSAWLLIGLNADLFKTFAYIELTVSYYFIGTIVILVIFLFMYREVRKLNTFSYTNDCFKRTVVVLSIGLWYSFIIGMVMFSFVGQHFIRNDQSLAVFYREKLPKSGFRVVANHEIKDKIDKGKEIQLDELWDGLERIYKNDYPIKARLYPSIKGSFSFTYFPVFFYMMVLLALFIGVFIELLANDRKMADPF